MRRILLFAVIGFALVGIIIVVVTILARRQPAQPTTRAPRGPASLTIWRFSDDEAIFKPLIEQFAQENPEIKIEYVKKELKDYEAQATNALAAGKGPDIWSIPDDWLARHADKLVPTPDGLLKRDRNDRRTNEQVVAESYVPVVAKQVVLNGKVLGLPLTVDTLALYLNTGELNRLVTEKFNQGVELDDIIRRQELTTWNDLVTFVKALTVRTKDSVGRSIIGLGSGSNVEVAPELLAAIMIQNRAQMISPDAVTAIFHLPAKKSTGATFNPGKEALDFYTAFANPAKEVFTWAPSFPNAQQAFLEGKTLMAFGYSDFARTINQLKPDLNVRILPLPQIAGTREPIDFAAFPVETVTNNAENPEVAWRFVKFLATTGLTEYLAATERPSPVKSSFAPTTLQDRVKGGPPFKFQPNTAVSWDKGKDPDAVEALFRQMADDVVARGINSQEALDGAAKQATEIIRKAAGFEPPPVEEKKQ